MSESDTEATDGAVSEAGEEPPQTPADSDGADESEQEAPAIASDERAELPGLEDVADQVESEAGAGSSDEEDDDQEDDADDDGGGNAGEELATSFGDLYVDSLAAVLGAIVEEHGDDPDPDMDGEAIHDLAAGPPFNLDGHVDALADEMGAESDLSPQQAVVLSTCAIIALVLVKETDVAGSAVSALSDKMADAEALQ